MAMASLDFESDGLIELFRVFVCLCVVAFERERDGAMEDG